jgi:hypothetical protein
MLLNAKSPLFERTLIDAQIVLIGHGQRVGSDVATEGHHEVALDSRSGYQCDAFVYFCNVSKDAFSKRKSS